MSLVLEGSNQSVEQMIKSTRRGLLVSFFWYIRAVGSADAAQHRHDARRAVPHRERRDRRAGAELPLEHVAARRLQQRHRRSARAVPMHTGESCDGGGTALVPAVQDGRLLHDRRSHRPSDDAQRCRYRISASTGSLCTHDETSSRPSAPPGIIVAGSDHRSPISSRRRRPGACSTRSSRGCPTSRSRKRRRSAAATPTSASRARPTAASTRTAATRCPALTRTIRSAASAASAARAAAAVDGGGGGFGAAVAAAVDAAAAAAAARVGAAGFGVRVIHSGTWGFASSPIVTEDEIRRITRIAADVAPSQRHRQEDRRQARARAGLPGLLGDAGREESRRRSRARPSRTSSRRSSTPSSRTRACRTSTSR